MVTTPALMPVTEPNESTEPTAGLLLLQTPPGVTSPNVVVVPTQTFIMPVIGPIAKDATETKTRSSVRVRNLKFFIDNFK
jgi:hypothetical protein